MSYARPKIGLVYCEISRKIKLSDSLPDCSSADMSRDVGHSSPIVNLLINDCLSEEWDLFDCCFIAEYDCLVWVWEFGAKTES